jgi:hypothetical protein
MVSLSVKLLCPFFSIQVAHAAYDMRHAKRAVYRGHILLPFSMNYKCVSSHKLSSPSMWLACKSASNWPSQLPHLHVAVDLFPSSHSLQ